MVLFPRIAELKAKAKSQMEGSLGTLCVYGWASLLATLVAVAAIMAVFTLVFFWAFGISGFGGVVVGLMVLAIIGAVYLISAGFAYSFANIYLRLSDGIKPTWKDLFFGFKNIWRAAWVMLIEIAFLLAWFLAIYIPALLFLIAGPAIMASAGWGFWSMTLTLLGGLLILLGVVLIIASIFAIIIKALSFSMSLFVAIDNPEISGYAAIKKSSAIMEGKKSMLYELSFSFELWVLASIATFGFLFFYTIPYMEMTVVNFYKEIK